MAKSLYRECGPTAEDECRAAAELLVALSRQSRSEAIAKLLLRLLAVAAAAIGVFGAVYNARDGMIFAVFAWLFLGAIMSALFLAGARS